MCFLFIAKSCLVYEGKRYKLLPLLCEVVGQSWLCANKSLSRCLPNGASAKRDKATCFPSLMLHARPLYNHITSHCLMCKNLYSFFHLKGSFFLFRSFEMKAMTMIILPRVRVISTESGKRSLFAATTFKSLHFKRFLSMCRFAMLPVTSPDCFTKITLILRWKKKKVARKIFISFFLAFHAHS